jgi:D-alanyl-D-alanine dipeptidase
MLPKLKRKNPGLNIHLQKSIGLLVACLLFIAAPVRADLSAIEKNLIENGLVDVQSLDSSIQVQLAYASTHNFMRKNVYGNLKKCYLQKEIAAKLIKAQKRLQSEHPGYSLIVFDGARPRRIQYQMWAIVKGTAHEHYVANPKIGSIHNYGAAVDLSILDNKGNELDMGTSFDYLGDLAQPQLEQKFLKQGKLTPLQIKNRLLLRRTMTEAGFIPLATEWWHFNGLPGDQVRKKYKIIE